MEKQIDWNDYVRKWGKFWDDGEKIFVIGKLSGYDGKMFYIKDYGYFDFFEPLTKEQIKILGLE